VVPIDSSDQTSINIGFGKNRIETLTDGIFAFSMTLLVTGIDIPQVQAEFNATSAYQVLRDVFPDLIHYVLAFLIIAVFWYIHHTQFHKVRSVDLKLLWINVITLLFVALIPFSTSLIGDYSYSNLAHIVFESNLLITGLFIYWQWSYATANRHLIDPAISPEQIRNGKLRALIVPGLSALAIILASLHVSLSTIVYMFAPVLLVYLYMKEEHIPFISE
jgi:uncharacterized membrane protein